VPLTIQAQLIALKQLLYSHQEASVTASKASAAAEKKRLQKLEREERARAAGVMGKSPSVAKRSWADITGTAKTNVKMKVARPAVEQLGKLEQLEANGIEITFGVPGVAGYQKHHAHLLAHGEERMKEVLDGLGCKFKGFNAVDQQITVFFPGEALATFFKALDKEGAHMSPMVVTTQQFFGKHWISGAADKAIDKDREIATAHDDEWLVHQKSIHLKRLRNKFDAQIKDKEEDVGRLTSAELTSEGQAKETAAQALGAEKATLQSLLDEKMTAERAASKMWERRRPRQRPQCRRRAQPSPALRLGSELVHGPHPQRPTVDMSAESTRPACAGGGGAGRGRGVR